MTKFLLERGTVGGQPSADIRRPSGYTFSGHPPPGFQPMNMPQLLYRTTTHTHQRPHSCQRFLPTETVYTPILIALLSVALVGFAGLMCHRERADSETRSVVADASPASGGHRQQQTRPS